MLPAATPTTTATARSTVGPTGGGYVEDLLRDRGMSDIGARTVELLVVRPLRIVLIVVVAILAARWGGGLLRRFLLSLGARTPLRPRSARGEQRPATIADAVAGFWRVVVVIISALMILAEVGVNLVPLLAGASIAGLAIGFAAQTLIRDYLSGVFILAEDQYGVGDLVSIGTVSSPVAAGVVEDVSLRVTRLRAEDGTLCIVPNGDIRALANRSMVTVVPVPVPVPAPEAVPPPEG